MENEVLEMILYAIYDIWCMERRKEQSEVQQAIDNICDYFKADKDDKHFVEEQVTAAVSSQEGYAFRDALKFSAELIGQAMEDK